MKRTLLTLIIFTFTVSFALAETIVVDVAGGGDYTRIHDAVAAASDGDTVLVNSGIHYFSALDGFVTVDKSLVIQGFGYDLPENGGTTIQSNQAIFLFTADADNSVLRGFRLNGIGNPMVTVNSNETVIEENIFMNRQSTAASLSFGSTLQDTARNNLFIPSEGNIGGGISATSNTDLLINNNLFAGINGTGVYVQGNSNDKIMNNVFVKMAGYGAQNGINQWNVNNGYFAGNIFYQNQSYALYSPSGSPSILNNCFNGNSNDGSTGNEAITSDPSFVDFGASDSYDHESYDNDNYNFRLDTGSPCIDAGPLLVDYNDLDGSRNDMGMYGWIWPIGTTGAPTIPVVNSISVTPTTVSPSGTITIQATGRIGE